MNQLICRATGETYPLNDLRWCSDSGGLLDLDLKLHFDPDRIKRRRANLWRYRKVLPLGAPVEPVSLGEPVTPLTAVAYQGQEVRFKQDYLFPTGSYKDRGAAVMISQAAALGVKRVVQDSSGNAGCSVAAYAARAGIACEIFVPADTSPAKLTQIRAYGAQVRLVPGSREDTAAAAMEAARDTFYASHVWNPFFFQGTKTFAYEVCEQLNWDAPDTVILPAGNGTLILGAFIGFRELHQMGIIRHIPRIIAVQAANCAPLYTAFEAGADDPVAVETDKTLAEGIAIALPRRGKQMLEYVRESGGKFLAVEEEEIREALREMVSKGYFIEPTSAAVVAGVGQYLRHHAEPGERIVSIMTGSGLKSVEKITGMLA